MAAGGQRQFGCQMAVSRFPALRLPSSGLISTAVSWGVLNPCHRAEHSLSADQRPVIGVVAASGRPPAAEAWTIGETTLRHAAHPAVIDAPHLVHVAAFPLCHTEGERASRAPTIADGRPASSALHHSLRRLGPQHPPQPPCSRTSPSAISIAVQHRAASSNTVNVQHRRFSSKR